MVRHGDDQWFDIVKWTLFAMIDGVVQFTTFRGTRRKVHVLPPVSAETN